MNISLKYLRHFLVSACQLNYKNFNNLPETTSYHKYWRYGTGYLSSIHYNINEEHFIQVGYKHEKYGDLETSYWDGNAGVFLLLVITLEKIKIDIFTENILLS